MAQTGPTSPEYAQRSTKSPGQRSNVNPASPDAIGWVEPCLVTAPLECPRRAEKHGLGALSLSHSPRPIGVVRFRAAILAASLAAMLWGCGRSPEPFGTMAHPSTDASGSSLRGKRSDVLMAGFRDWIKAVWDTNSLETGLHFAAEGDPRARALALEKLFTKRSSMSAQELQQFHLALEKQIRTTSDPPLVVASSIRTLAHLLDYLKARGLVTEGEIAADGAVLLQHLRDTALDLQVRGAAIRVRADLKMG